MTTATSTVDAPIDAEPEWGVSTALLPHEQANLEAFEGVFPHWNTRDIPRMLDFYEDDIVWRNVAMGEVYAGKPAVAAFLGKLFAALPDFSLEVTLRLPRGRYVAEEYVIRGTHSDTLFGLPATGRRVAIPAMSMVEMRNGRLKEDHFYFDAADALRQMGMLPGFDLALTPLGGAALRLVVARRTVGRAAAGAAALGLVAGGMRRAGAAAGARRRHG